MREHCGGCGSPRRDVVGLAEVPVAFAMSPGMQRQLHERKVGLAEYTCLVNDKAKPGSNMEEFLFVCLFCILFSRSLTVWNC